MKLITKKNEIEDFNNLHKKLNLVKQTNNKLKIQDRDLQEMKDDGMCLTMHQPWATLLIRGLKKLVYLKKKYSIVNHIYKPKNYICCDLAIKI